MADTPTDASTAKPQTDATLNPDLFTEASASDKKAAAGKGKKQAPDPLLDKANDTDDERGLPGTDPSVEGEIDVKARDAVVLMDPFTGKHFSQDETTTTPQTEFVKRKLDAGELVKA